MLRAKVAKKKTSSELPVTNGNDASSSSVAEEGAANVADDTKQAAKSKARGKKMPAATASAEVNDVQEADVVAKKSAVRARRKPAEKVEVIVEDSEPPKPRGRAKKLATEVSDEPKTKAAKPRSKKSAVQEDTGVEDTEPPKPRGRAKKLATEVTDEPKTKATKPRSKKEKPSALEEPEVTKGRAKKEKTSLNEEAAITVAPTKEADSKARGRKKEPEKKTVTESAEQAESVKGRAKKELIAPETKGRAKKADAVAAEESTIKTATTKGARVTKRLADTEIAEVLEAEEDPEPEPEPEPETQLVNKKRPKQAKSNNENVEVPAKKPRRKAATNDPQQDLPSVEMPATSKKRTQKKVNDDIELEELKVPESKPARGRKRPAAGAEENANAISIDAADGSRTSKAKKPATQKVEAAAAGIYEKSLFTSPTDKPFNLKISSWNVAGLRAWLKKDGLKFVDFEEPDIFCLQETKCVNDQLPDEMTRLPGYHPYWLCMPGGYAGVAIYSKIMPINVEYGIGNPEFDDVGRMITAEYEKFYLINVYVPNSGRKLVNLEMRMRWEQLFQAYVQKLDALKPVVICGDMNVSHTEIDLANPKNNTRNAGFTKEEREKMTDLLALGYVDTYRHLYPERTGAYTFWTYMSNARARNVGWRLDYCLVSERFVSRIVDNVMRSHCLGSDHCPITVFLNV
ncbi:recombination repair protein 1 [Drosophila novamexicana]|uniref:recombination repair protein 1 n=1 Tax=Drosophila novamexicana TaxID=47314 RepID=UPI0011E5C6AD|nr:recombination repair protein 1 [Drosophila novamexicana]